MIGKTVTHYKILEKLGEGGMGIVYKAHDTKLDRVVALKFLPHYLTSDPTEKERFYHEARAASALLHPSVAVIFEINEHEGQVFIAMEYVEGKTLKQIVSEETLSIKKVLDIAIQVSDGLAVAHEKGIVHRDVKSENIMVTPKGQPKIMDFGLAKVRGATKLTKEGSTLGTAAYMSPEQARGEDVDHRSDIFSFGVVLYEMLTGRLPFKGEHHAALLYSIINDEPQPVARFNEQVTPEIEHIVAKALEKDREDRYQHIDEMQSDLRRERKALEYAKTVHLKPSRVQAPVATDERVQPAPVAPPAPPAPPAAPAQVAPSATLASPARPRKRLLGFLIPAAIVVLAIVLLVLFKPFRFQIGPKKTAATDSKSIAVLPFTNMSENKGDDFFSDGITEDIIAALSNIGELKVISRTSIMQYKNTKKNLRDIAKELGVATVLEGSVRRADHEVRIVAQLIDAKSDKHLWAQTYDKELTQIFAIQSDVAQQIASALKAELSPRERQRVTKRPTANVDAYAYYLRGREYYYRYSKQDNENAIVLFKKALELDPDYALAHAGLGDAYGQRTYYGGFPPAWSDSAIAASNLAISIDPTLAEGYKALGLAYGNKGWIKRSLEAYRKAIELNPNYQPAFGNTSYMNEALGKFDEAFRWQKRSLALNPMFPYTYYDAGTVYMDVGDYTRALEWFNKALALQPDFAAAKWAIAGLYFAEGKYQQCIEQAEKLLSSDPDDIGGLISIGRAELMSGDYQRAQERLAKACAIDSVYGSSAYLGYVYFKNGRRAEAGKVFARALQRDERELAQGNEYADIPFELAEIYAVQGNKTEAYKWLQRSIDAGWRNYRYTLVDPLLENLRNDGRFKQMVADVKAMVDEMRRRVEEIDKE